MCIRDSTHSFQGFAQNGQTVFRVVGEGDEGVDSEPGFPADTDELIVGQDEMGGVEGGPGTVSYTHLTLPTSDLV